MTSIHYGLFHPNPYFSVYCLIHRLSEVDNLDLNFQSSSKYLDAKNFSVDDYMNKMVGIYYMQLVGINYLLYIQSDGQSHGYNIVNKIMKEF